MGQSSQQTTQQSQTSPWAAAMPTVNGLFNGVNSLIPNSGLNSAESGAINQLTANGQAGNPYAPAIGNTATTLLNGGGATNQAGAVNQNYLDYQRATQPLASNTNYDPMSTPGLGAELSALNNNITNSVNGQFASAGRSGSGANAYALASGLAAGEAPLLTAQYNQNIQNQQGAAGNLYNAGNTTSGLQTGLNQQGLTNQQSGITAAGQALNAQNYGPQTVLAAQELGQQLPAQNLGLLANIGIPLAGLGSSSNGTSNTTNNPSLLSELTGIGGLFSAPAGGTSAAAGLGQAAAGAGSGLLGLLSRI